MMKIHFLAVAVLFTANAHAAAPKFSPDPQLDRCLASGQTEASGIAQVLSCYRTALKRVDAALASQRGETVAKLKAAGTSATALIDGERAWAAYRDKWCAFEVAEADPDSHEATGLECKVELPSRISRD